MFGTDRKVPLCAMRNHGPGFSLIELAFLGPWPGREAPGRGRGSCRGERPRRRSVPESRPAPRASSRYPQCHCHNGPPQLRHCCVERRHASWSLHEQKTTAMTSHAPGKTRRLSRSDQRAPGPPAVFRPPTSEPTRPSRRHRTLCIPTDSENAIASGPHSLFPTHHVPTHAPHIFYHHCFFSPRESGTSDKSVSSRGRHEITKRRSPRAACSAHVAGERLRQCAVT